MQDMLKFSEMMFGKCEVQDLFEGTFLKKDYPDCFLLRVKKAGAQNTLYAKWGEHVKSIQDEIVATDGQRFPTNPLAPVQVQGSGVHVYYKTMQICSSNCTCRVGFGGAHRQAKVDLGASKYAT